MFGDILDHIIQIQWNLDLTKCQGTGEIGSLYRGFQRRSQDFCIGGFQMGIVIVNVKPSAGGTRPLGGSGGMAPREISKFVVPRNGISLILSINF